MLNVKPLGAQALFMSLDQLLALVFPVHDDAFIARLPRLGA